MTNDSILLHQLRTNILVALTPKWGSNEAMGISNLILEHLGFNREMLLRKPNHPIHHKIQTEVKKILQELKQNIPIQYILGYTFFYDIKLELNPQVLIPRLETEELVDLIIREHRNTSPRILDIGTGSGCIPIALKKNIPNAEIYALDIAKGALKTAQQNASQNEVNISFIQENILTVPEWKDKPALDIIVSNPPYVTEKEKEMMLPQVMNHEPHLALFVTDKDPLIFYRSIAKFINLNCRNACFLYLEINEQYGNETAHLLKSYDFQNVSIIKDMQGKDRMIKAQYTNG